MKIEKAIRQAIPFIGCLYGKSGSGKTYSALKLAQGLIDSTGKRIGFIDTENKRASHYADEFDFDVINLNPPFTPNRFKDAISSFEKTGLYGVIIIDSISHEWEGTGGCVEIADSQITKSGAKLSGLIAWSRPKQQHKALMNHILQSNLHIILCARSKDLTEVNGNDIKKIGETISQEKNFKFEMLLCVYMDESGKKVKVEKCQKGLSDVLRLKEGEYLGIEHGKAIKNWIYGGAKINETIRHAERCGREISITGTLDDLRQWYLKLDNEIKTFFKNNGFFDELKEAIDTRDDVEQPSSSGAQLPQPPAIPATPQQSQPVKTNQKQDVQDEEKPEEKEEPTEDKEDDHDLL